VSFNGWSSVEKGNDISFYKTQVCTRLIDSFFCISPSIGMNCFNKFSVNLTNNRELNIDMCLNCLDYHFEEVLKCKPPPYMILVDKLEKTEKAKDLCSYICKNMDNRNLGFDCLFTSLDFVWVVEAHTKALTNTFIGFHFLPLHTTLYNYIFH